ncbi:hypothetical protein GCM10027074_37900 [Streptomyces deserti]
MLGHLGVVQVAFHPACVQPDQQATQLVAQVHVIVSPSVRIGQAAPRGPVLAAAVPVRMAVPEGEAYPRRHGEGPTGVRPTAAARPHRAAAGDPPGQKKRAGPWGGYGPARGGASTITLRK